MTSQFLQLVLILAMAQTPSIDSFSPRERSDAVKSMAVLGNRDAVPSLVDAYHSEPRRDIRGEIVAALGRIRDLSALPGLTEAVRTDFQRDVRLQAIDSILRLYIPIADEDGLFSFIGGVTSLFSDEERPRVGANVQVDQSAKEALVQVVRADFDWEVRREAVYALASLAAVDQLPPLIEELEGPRHREDWEVRTAMVAAMGQFRDEGAGPALTRLIRDEDERVREASIQAIGLIGYRPAYPALSNLFRSSFDDDVREYALQSIALMRDPDAVSLFEPLLDSREEKERELAAEGLARLDYDASGFVARMEEEDEDSVRLALAFALAASGQSAYMQPLVDALDTRRPAQAEVYLYELGRFEGQIDQIYPHLRNPESDIRERLLGVMGRIGNVEARPYIEPLTEDRDTGVAQAAVAALRQLAGR
jgi:HEAT repeat protein